MKQLFVFICLLAGQGLFANMASPVRPGTYGSSVLSSRNIDILSENIRITPAADFKTADFAIEYHIRADSAGNQIPLLFHALDYQGDFRVNVDGQEIVLQPLPDDYLQAGTPLTDKFPVLPGNELPEFIYWEKNSRQRFLPNDFKFFQTGLSRGEHRIRVDYTAKVWTDRSGWIKNYSFRYSLSPARYWRSFGVLDIQLDTIACSTALETNLGKPASRQGSQVNWHFSELPADYIGISYMPAISTFALMLIGIGPMGLTAVFAILLILLHILLIKRFRERHPERSLSWILILGSLAVPFLMLASFPLAYDIIDKAIGPDAGRYHGYNFLVIVLYPFLLPVYGLIMWFIDRRFKRQLSAKTTKNG